MDERQKLLRMMREIRKKISPEVLEMAHRAAMQQIGEKPPAPSENEAARLFKIANANNGARRSEILAYLERKFRSKLN